MPKNPCYHCGQMLDDTERRSHDCWSTTEDALTQDLSEDLMDAWVRLRETAADLGEQRIYASHRSIMFSRKACYFFVRPQKSFLEVCFFLDRTIRAPQIRKTVPTSRIKVAHTVRVVHRDEVESPLTDWLREAYEFAGEKAPRARVEEGGNRRKRAAPARSASTPPAGKTFRGAKKRGK